ncbi:MAG: tryptophan 7-halogenase [Betaproteobacteria bacterium]|nr:tryptophan 7-halogenase [Betaproteobacteria bacterium]
MSDDAVQAVVTATLYNRNYLQSRAAAAGAPPPGIRRLVIVGGGTAGWMSAMIFARAFEGQDVEISVVESPAVGIIGVGEGSTPWLRGFFDSLDIEEREWMPACHATYKCGIRFSGWSTKPGFESYFHPFASMLDNLTMTQFVHQVESRVNGADVAAHPDRFFIATRLANERRAPKPARAFPFDVWYGYHFDAVLLGQYLQKKAIERGVRYRPCHVTHANLDAQGRIASIGIKDAEPVEGDFFVDCSGFAGLLMQQALNVPFVSFADNLFNDAAVAMPTPIGAELPCETVATALRHGWEWKIPLTSRYGNGYVYSSSFCSADEAERELRERLGLLDDPAPARHLKMKIGRLTEHWSRNCAAIGLSQGFIEPLEATALLFIQRTATLLAESLAAGRMDDRARGEFNARINEHFEGTRDYIVSHYKTNSRTDTEYWRANAANTALSEPLRMLFGNWLAGKRISQTVRRQQIGKGYPVFSWYCLLAGMGIFPEPRDLRPATAAEACFDLEGIDNLLERSASNFPRHADVLRDIPPRVAEKSLQLYLW